jgi:hypothetical protein
MPDWLQNIGEFLGGLPRLAFGDRVDSALGIVAITCTVILVIAFAIGAVRSVWELAKAVDLGFDKDKLDRYIVERPPGTASREIDWTLARKQQVRSLRFTIPFGLVVLAAFVYWVRQDFTLKGYVIIAVGSIVVFMLLRPWWIWTYLRTQRKLVKTGEVAAKDAPLHNKRLKWAMKHYFAWGLQEATYKRRAFIGRLRWLNPIIGIFRLNWLRVRLIWPLVICAVYAAFWLITLPIAVFNLNHEFDDRNHPLKPKWAKSWATEPTYGTGAIPDTPGDAAAAAR